MADPQPFVLGEASRTLDERFRLSLPVDLVEALGADTSAYMLAKERSGCLSLWSLAKWREKHERDVELVRAKMEAGRLEGRLQDLQLLGRMLSSRHCHVTLAGRGRVPTRLLIPEGFREFLGVEAGGDVMVVGAAVCIELWNPARWLEYLEQQLPEFRQVLDRLAE